VRKGELEGSVQWGMISFAALLIQRKTKEKTKKVRGGEKRSSGSTQAKKKYGQSRVCIPGIFTTRESVRGKALQQKWMDGEGSLDNTEEKKEVYVSRININTGGAGA
jgi:CRISPR/Cas system CSM-associated protein Csm3 (group 7 of RAMP superfamily)